MRKKISVLVMACVVFLTTLTLNVEIDQDGVFGFTTNVKAQTTPPPMPICFVRTISDCPSVGGASGGQRVTCDLTGVSVPKSTCTPVVCVFGAKDPLICDQPPA